MNLTYRECGRNVHKLTDFFEDVREKERSGELSEGACLGIRLMLCHDCSQFSLTCQHFPASSPEHLREPAKRV